MLVTLDKDFGELAVVPGIHHSGLASSLISGHQLSWAYRSPCWRIMAGTWRQAQSLPSKMLASASDGPQVPPRRLNDLIRFYDILDHLERKCGGRRRLANCHGRMGWPRRGVYFFMEEGENRTDTGEGLRVVRVGTHALTASSRATLWNRLSQHRGQGISGGGNHRGSIFRLLVGSTLINPANPCATWGNKSSAPRDVRQAEESLEQAVSAIVRAMPFLWLAVDDEPGPQSLRGHIERNAIALLSNLREPTLDQPSPRWRGRACVRSNALVRDSGLWNQRHVDEDYDSAFLELMYGLVSAQP